MIPCSSCNQHPCICHQTVPIHPVNLFGSPFDCRRQIRTKHYASPNSSFPQNELDDLQACIDGVNHLLRSLGTQSNPINTRQLQLHFLDLKGAVVRAKILCGIELANDEDEEYIVIDGITELDTLTEDGEQNLTNQRMKLVCKKGKLANAGRDFIQINPIGSSLFILYRNLLSIERDECDDEGSEPKFIDADQETRRELAFNFGVFVSNNADIENLFFGIPLYKALIKYVGKEVKVRTNEECLNGVLVQTGEGRIQILNKETKRDININSICYLQVLNLK